MRFHESELPAAHPLYRPRHGRRHRAAMTCAAVFFLLPLVAFAAGVRPVAFENHPLAHFPSLGQGWRFFTSLSDWATDHLPLRRASVLAENGISTGVFGELPPRRHDDARSPLDASGPRTTNHHLEFPAVIQGTANWLYLGQVVANKCAPTQSLDRVISLLRRLREYVEASGRTFVLVIAPDKMTMVPSHLPADYPGKTCARRLTDAFWQRVPQAVGAIDLRPALRQAAQRSGHPLYNRNDTHWTYQGGVVMTYALADRLKPDAIRSWKVSATRVTPWPADLPPLLGKKGTRHLQRYSLAPDGRTDRTEYLASDFRTPLDLTTRPGSPMLKGMINQPVGMIADSFTQFASPFLAATVRNITIVHPETAAADPAGIARRLLTDKSIIVVELAERNIAGGASKLLRPRVIDTVGHVLASHPLH